MIETIVNEMIQLVAKLQGYIQQDIKDIEKAEHEKLLNRNDEKQLLIEKIAEYKQKLNEEILKQIQNGVDVNIYRDKVDNLELKLKNLYELNQKLAFIVQPIQQMYKDIVDEITQKNGGSFFHVKA